MIDVAVRSGVLEAVDVGKNEVTVETEGWEPIDAGPALDRRVDCQLSGTVRGLSLPEAVIAIEHIETGEWEFYHPQSGPTDLTGRRSVLKVEQSVIVYVALAAAGQLEQPPEADRVHVTFDEPSPVTIGFRSRINRPRETVTVPATLDGARTAIQYATAGLLSDTAEKSFPSQRVHPPAVEFGETTTIPAAVREKASSSEIRLAVPRSLEALLTVAPLSYYLQTTIEFTPDSGVRLEAPTLDDPLTLGGSRALAHDVAALLRRVFYLDCLVRNAGPHAVELEQSALLDELELTADAVYSQPNAERLAVYLATDFSTVTDRLPNWHLSTVIEPDFASLPTIPHLLNQLSLVQTPDPVSVDRPSLVTESVQESFAARAGTPGAKPPVELVKNRTRLGRQQGWMADGTPVDAFRATRAAFESRFRYYEESDGPRQVLVVINDRSMLDEGDGVEAIYRDRSAELSIDVAVEADLACAELRTALESSVDFLHFIGHCDAAGLRCEDGWVSTATLDGSGVQTFFLNACDSFREGLELVRSGSVAGAVTTADVLNEEATRVGTTFARLVMHGFSISRALALASRRSIRSKFYTVVGDGTHRLSQGADAFPAVLTAQSIGSEEFSLRFEFPQLKVAGGLAKPRVPSDAKYVLRGTESSFVLERPALTDFLRSVDLPVIFENEFHWSTALAERVTAGDEPERSIPDHDKNHGRTNNN